MDLPFFKGMILGFSIAAPVGPIGILCIRRTLDGDFRTGFLAGLGAATADGLYGLTAALGLAALSSFLIEWNTPLRIGGALFLLFLGTRAILSPSTLPDNIEKNKTEKSTPAYLSTFFLTLTNPMTILSFSAIFASLGPVHSPALLVAGVFSGSAAWWLLLCGVTQRLGDMLPPSAILYIRRGSGVLLLAFAVAIFLF